MLSKKKKIIILCGMVALLVVTGVLNIVLNRAAETPVEGTQNYQTLFQTYRADRIATRNDNRLLLEAIVANEASSAEAKAAAEQQLQQMATYAEQEVALEGLIKAIGFEDAFITLSTENINIIVKADAMTEDEANRILAVIMDEMTVSPLNVIVTPIGALPVTE